MYSLMFVHGELTYFKRTLWPKSIDDMNEDELILHRHPGIAATNLKVV